MSYGLLRIGIVNEEPPYAEPHVRWCERSENESRRKLLHFPPTRFCRSFDCEPVIAENVSVYRDFLFDRHLTEWPRTGNETGKETGNETGKETGNDPEVIQIVIQMIQK